MSLLRIALAVSIVAGLSSSVVAQTAAAPDADGPPTVGAALDQSAAVPPAPPAPPAMAATGADAAAGANSSVTVGADGVRSLHIASSPVPDTVANRKKFGRPMSHAGRVTPPAGN